SPATLADLLRAIGPDRLIFSLDLKQSQPLVGSQAWHGLDALSIARLALRLGVRRLIVLDLAQVGMNGGVATLPLCRSLRCLDDRAEIIAGGGVRSEADLDALAKAGCDGALVASALHDGRLQPTTTWARGAL